MIIDLRSDTVTKPSKEMMEAMLNAKVGDDVFAEDPTVIELENYIANLFGHEAALFCPSGTMTNQIGIKVHTNPGEEILCDYHSHIYHYETGGVASNSGVQIKLLHGDRGRINPSLIEQNINSDYDWNAKTSLVSIENTVNKAGGSFYTLQQLKDISNTCKKNNLKLHLDGARIFNAIIEAHYSPKEIGSLVNSISVCLSKGLGAPVGSLLIGNKDFIKQARRRRKSMGGGMRQAGILAAAGIYALHHNIEKLIEDHRRAKDIANVLKSCAYVENILPVDTNILIFDLATTVSFPSFQEKLLAHNIKISQFGPKTVRMVTHLDFNDDMLNTLLNVLKSRITL
jgi:threonine aldolase